MRFSDCDSLARCVSDLLLELVLEKALLEIDDKSNCVALCFGHIRDKKNRSDNLKLTDLPRPVAYYHLFIST